MAVAIKFTTKKAAKPTGLARVAYKPWADILYKKQSIGFIQGNNIWFRIAIKSGDKIIWENRMFFPRLLEKISPLKKLPTTHDECIVWVKENSQLIWDKIDDLYAKISND